MADQGWQPNHPVQYIPAHRDQHRRLLDAARALMLLGAVVGVTAMDDATPQVFFLGFVTWLLGVCLLYFMPVAGRFPQADQALLGAAIAKAVLRHLQMMMIPWN
jgi:hypothetical protein